MAPFVGSSRRICGGPSTWGKETQLPVLGILHGPIYGLLQAHINSGEVD